MDDIETAESNTNSSALQLKNILDKHQQTQQENFKILPEILGATLNQFGDVIATGILDLKQKFEDSSKRNRLNQRDQSEDPRTGKRLNRDLAEHLSRKRQATSSEGEPESDSALDKDQMSFKR